MTLNAINIPVAVVIGKEDPIVGASQIAVFDAVQVNTVDGAGHFDVIHPKTEAFSAVVKALEAIKGKVAELMSAVDFDKLRSRFHLPEARSIWTAIRLEHYLATQKRGYKK